MQLRAIENHPLTSLLCKLNHHQLKKTWDFWESFQNCKLTMPEAATAIFYAEEFFFLQAG